MCYNYFIQLVIQVSFSKEDCILNNLSDFVISDGILLDYKGPGGNIIIPEGIQEIKSGYFNGEFWTDKGAFDYCNTITSIVFQIVYDA